MKIIGHRGAAGLAVENSLEGINIALSLPLYAVEIDVRRTKDGQLILMHDPTTGRSADQNLWISSTDLKDLKELRLNNGEPIPTLDEALKLIGDKMPVVLDLKSSDIGSELKLVLEKHKKTQVTVSSRNYSQLRRLHKIIPNVPFLARAYLHSLDTAQIAKQMGASGISINKWLLNPITYFTANNADLEIQSYTVNHPLQVRLFRILYPKIAIYTDYPDKYAKISNPKHR